jgi:TolB-like protein/DNA-binding winged helix-turn-helix (wHTH) protein/Flp pilus assembly protein TadD
MSQSNQVKGLYEFGSFRLDAAKRLLTRAGVSVTLAPKTFDLLLLLAESQGRALTKVELMQALWPDTFVEEANLSFQMSALRKALGEDGAHWVETVPKHGYRFTAVVKGVADGGGSRGIRRAYWMAAALALLLLAVAVFYLVPGHRKAIDSLAVLPFVNTGGNPDAEYLTDGIAETLINDLSTLPGLKVIARSSAFRFKGRDADPQAAGRQLKVQAVLTGRVVQRGDSLSVQAELVDVGENRHLWGEQFSGKLSDLPVLQAEISRAITARLRSPLTGEERKVPVRRQTASAAAYQNYLRGVYFVAKRTPDALRKGEEYLEQAVAADPTYGAAYAALADTYTHMTTRRMLAPREANRKVEAAAGRALQLDPGLSQAHTALGGARRREFDMAGTERELRLALELEPNNADAHTRIALTFLMPVGRFDEAVEENRRAQELDPLSLIIIANAGEILYLARRYDQALKEYRKLQEMDPNFSSGAIEGLVYAELGRFPEAIAAAEQAASRAGVNSRPLALLGYVRARSGDRSGARQALAELKQISQSRYVDSYDVALVHAALGDRDAAFALLEQAYAELSAGTRDLKVDPKLDPLRSDPRFADLLRRAGLGP